MESRRLNLPRASRIKQGSDFARAKAKGERLVCGCLIANLLPRPDEPRSRIGVITSRKVGGAVVRSRARRLLRESFRLHQYDFPMSLDVVLIARQSIVEKDFAGVEHDFLQALKKARITKAS